MTDVLGKINVSTVIQGLIALVAIGGTFALVLNHVAVPDIIMILDGAITAYYFSTVTATNTARAVIKEQNNQ